MRREHGLTVLFLAGERPYVIDLEGETPGTARGAGRAGRPRPRAAVPVEPARDRVASARAGASPDRRLPRRGAVARRTVRRVGRDRARPPGPRRRRPRARARLRRAVAARRRARRRRRAVARCARCSSAWSSTARRCSSIPDPGPSAARLPTARRRGVARRSPVVAGADPLCRRDARRVAGVPQRRAARSIPELRVDLLDARRPRPAARRAPVLARRSRRLPARPAGVLRDLLLRARGASVRSRQVVGREQLLYGSDRPVVEPARARHARSLDWDPIADGTRRALGDRAGRLLAR